MNVTLTRDKAQLLESVLNELDDERLQALGYDSDQIEAINDAHTELYDQLKIWEGIPTFVWLQMPRTLRIGKVHYGQNWFVDQIQCNDETELNIELNERNKGLGVTPTIEKLFYLCMQSDSWSRYRQFEKLANERNK